MGSAREPEPPGDRTAGRRWTPVRRSVSSSRTRSTISALPPTTLFVGFVVIVVAFLMFKRAF
jgi:hypothetical protein